MKFDIFPSLGQQLRQARKERHLTQPDLALRVGRNQARISEFERDLQTNRLGKDRLTLLVEICDALDLVPVLMTRSAAKTYIAPKTASARNQPTAQGTVFDDVFVDLSEEGED